ncbi:MAG: response regulator [Planctomycetes bacterium]|nr:response regulator [Planctomycetota bacterium]MCK5473756.1 response regulator [Planctomycetota bacterium]
MAEQRIKCSDDSLMNVLLVEDNLGDVRLTEEAIKDGKLAVNLYVASDGVDAMEFLRKEGENANAPTPDLVLLDLNLPRKNGHEVLSDIKTDSKLKSIPVVVLTSSEADTDIVKCYDLYANCYIAKPVDLEQFAIVVKTIKNFWFTIVRLPEEA